MYWLHIGIKGLRKILKKRDQVIEVFTRLWRVTSKNVLTPTLSKKKNEINHRHQAKFDQTRTGWYQLLYIFL